MSSLLEKSVNFNSKIKINFEGGNLTSDSGFANPELFKLIEENKAFYAIRLKANSSLYAKSEDLTKKMELECKDNFYDYKVVYGKIKYKANS